MCVDEEQYFGTVSQIARSFNEGKHEKYIRRALELHPFYSQCILIPGMAIERYILVCRPTQADLILKGRYKYLFYLVVALVSLLIPTIILLEFTWFQLNPIEFQTFVAEVKDTIVMADGTVISLPINNPIEFYREVSIFTIFCTPPALIC